MAHIRKLTNGTFQAAIYVGLSTELDSKGKPKKIYEYVTCKGEKECKTKAREIETDIENKTYSVLGKMKFSDYADKWLATKTVAPSTYISYKMYINTHFKPVFGRFLVKDVTEFNVKEYLSTKLKTLSGNTVKKHFFVLAEMFRDAMKIKSPCRDLESPKKDEYISYPIIESDFEMFKEVVKGTFDEIPLLLAGECGLREGEIFALKPDDLDDKKCIIRIDESRSISETGYEDKDPKSGRGKRQIVASDYLMGLLREYIKSKIKVKKKSNTEDIENTEKKKGHIGERLFNMRPDSYSKRFAKIIDIHNSIVENPELMDKINKGNDKSIGKTIHILSKKLPDVRFHDLRHYHAYLLYKNGVPDRYAADRLGHDIMVLKKIYQHLGKDFETKIDDQVKGFLNK